MASREREGEMSLSERNPLQWTMVQRRKPRTSTQMASKTCYITYLPTDITKNDLYNIFKPYGHITNISIPSPRSEKPRFRFAFIRYYNQNSMMQAIKGEDGRKLSNFRMKIRVAKKDSASITPPPTGQTNPTRSQNHPPPITKYQTTPTSNPVRQTVLTRTPSSIQSDHQPPSLKKPTTITRHPAQGQQKSIIYPPRT